jgi:Fe-S cluster biogenesis protein NfuA
MSLEFHLYKVTVKHDKGRSTLIVSSTDEFSASLLVQACEGCPMRAITKIQQVSKAQAKKVRGW